MPGQAAESPDSCLPTAEDRPPDELLRALRPREKLQARGAAALSAGELLSVVLGCGTRREPVTRLAYRLIRRHGLEGLAGLSADAWRAERGVGQVSAARLCAVFEVGRRA